jgi:peptidoglycan/xylan/chitin deacetylase (PgdA/CDA1 family)
VRGGVAVRRSHVLLNERRQRIPVLMYHRVAEDGPEALARYRMAPALFEQQVAWLRRNGFHTLDSDELHWFIANRVPFYGRPVLLTFDDGTQDFADTAWPILRRHDFKAEVMLVTDHIGGSADWDVAYGPPTPLMDAATISALARDGARFGSHLASHTPAVNLATRDLAAELLRARATVAALTGRTPMAFTAPYSLGCPRLPGLAAAAGHGIGYVARSGLASVHGEPLDTPRIEIRGDRDLASFVAIMEDALR